MQHNFPTNSYPNARAHDFFTPLQVLKFKKLKTLPAALLLLVLFSFGACTSDGVDAPDVSDIKINLQIERFDQEFAQIDTANPEPGLQAIAQKYPTLLPPYLTRMIRLPEQRAVSPLETVQGFLADPFVQKLRDTVDIVYKNMDAVKPGLEQLFRYYKYYFPEKPTPKVATVVSAFYTDAFVVDDSLMGLSLDMFLGQQFSGYRGQFPDFMSRQFTPEYIPVRMAKAIANDLNETPAGKNLLEEMLRNGKSLYIVKKLLPHTPDSLIMGYTEPQMSGCFSNEQEVWARILSQNLLYSSDFSQTRKLIEPSPNAPVVFQEAPGEIGNWIGWRIVESWMQRHPDADIKALLAATDAQKFLEDAKYKPKSK